MEQDQNNNLNERSFLQIGSLQGLRALAALMVVISHQLSEAGIAESYGWFIGKFGVNLFFLISGFIMVVTSRDKFGIATAPADFIWRRFVRIVPFYWLITAIYTIKMCIVGVPPQFEHLIKSFAFIPYLDSDGLFRPVYGLGWTLNYEMFFYAIFAVALSQKFWPGVAGVITTLLAVVAGGMILPIQSSETWFAQIWNFWTHPIILYFGVGIIAGILRGHFEKLGRLSDDRIVITTCLSVVLATLFSVSAYYMPPVKNFLFLACVSIFAICAFRKGSDQSTAYQRAIVLVGNASYSIYLTHSFLAGPSKKIWAYLFHGEYGAVVVILITLGSIVLGIASYRWVEKPLLRIQKLRAPFSPSPVQT